MIHILHLRKVERSTCNKSVDYAYLISIEEAQHRQFCLYFILLLLPKHRFNVHG